MGSDLSAERVSEIRALLERATGAPWEAPGDRFFEGVLCDAEETGMANFAGRGVIQDHANAALTAALRNAAPSLLSSAERCAEWEEHAEELIATYRGKIPRNVNPGTTLGVIMAAQDSQNHALRERCAEAEERVRELEAALGEVYRIAREVIQDRLDDPDTQTNVDPEWLMNYAKAALRGEEGGAT